jgi:hypothetical protein
LQSLSVGACTVDAFKELIVEELTLYSIQVPYDLSPKQADELSLAYQSLVTRWQNLEEGEALELELEIEKWIEVMS